MVILIFIFDLTLFDCNPCSVQIDSIEISSPLRSWYQQFYVNLFYLNSENNAQYAQ